MIGNINSIVMVEDAKVDFAVACVAPVYVSFSVRLLSHTLWNPDMISIADDINILQIIGAVNMIYTCI